mmetsp:Transcript_134464/g.318771  ORF Transcript_134464/g.318771 Transcript_134464/m.318771 type:complete len:205 (+) Transcript_134464:219-833(+)
MVGPLALSFSISALMRASRSSRTCFSHSSLATVCSLSKMLVHRPSGAVSNFRNSPSAESWNPANRSSSLPAPPATSSSLPLRAALEHFSCLNLVSSGFCSVLSSTLMPVLKKASWTSHSSSSTRARAAWAFSSSMAMAGGSAFLGGPGSSLGAGGGAGAGATPQVCRQDSMSKRQFATSVRPSEEIRRPVLPSRMMREGMPRTW